MSAPLHTASRIRELNDLFRTCFIGGRVLITEGIIALGDTFTSGCVEAVPRQSSLRVPARRQVTPLMGRILGRCSLRRRWHRDPAQGRDLRAACGHASARGNSSARLGCGKPYLQEWRATRLMKT